MSPESPPAPASAKTLWAGRILTALPAVMLIASAAAKLAQAAPVSEEFPRLGWPEGLILSLGVLEILCVIVYLIPRSAVLGAILLTGYLGGAVAAHVRIGDPFIVPVVLGVLLWGGLFFRDPRVRALLPLRS